MAISLRACLRLSTAPNARHYGTNRVTRRVACFSTSFTNRVLRFSAKRNWRPLYVTLHCSSSSPSSSSSSLPWTEVLPYRSVRIDLVTAFSEGWRLEQGQDFAAILQSHFQQWRSEGRSGVWLHLPLSLASLAPEAASVGFSLHHASPEQGSIVMCAWLEEGAASRLPHYASHHVGVSGVVYREDMEEVLVVQDKFKFVKWKFPGGLAEPSEDIADAAMREVREETGVHTEFRSILAFRHHHHMPQYFGCSDLYFLCRLHPLTFDLYPCEKEVVKCQWMSVQELAASDEGTPLSKRIAELLIERQEDFSQVDIVMETWPSIYKGQSYHLYLRTPKPN